MRTDYYEDYEDAFPDSGRKPNGSAHADGWPKPDMSVLQVRRPAPPFPLKLLSPWDRWISDAAESAGAPPDYVVAVLLPALSALLASARAVSPWAGWVEPCILWTCLIGDPSSNKSPASEEIMSALRDVERERGEGFDDLYREWQASAEAARTARERWKATVAAAVDADEDPPALPTEAETPEEPQRPRIIIGGSTIEKLALLLKANPRGLLCHRDEVSGLIGNFGQYNGAPGGDRAKWLEMWSAKTITVDRIKHPQPIVVDRPLVSLIGGIQPDRIASLLLKLGTDDDGFAARLLPFWPDPVPPRRPGRVPHREYLRRAMRRLSGLSGAPDGSPDVLRLTEHAAACMDDLRDRCFYAEASGKLKSAIGKFPGYAARLALVIQLARWAAGADGEPHPMEVDASSMEAAVGLIDSYFMPMAERLYGDASLPEEDRGAAVIARWITRHRVGRINARDLRRKRLPGLSESAPVRAAMASLVDAGWLRPDPSREGGTPGVPRSDYEVNPSLRVVS